VTTSEFELGSQDRTYAITSTVDLLGRPVERIFPDGEAIAFEYTGATNTLVEKIPYQGTAVPLFDTIRADPSGGLEKIRHAPPGITVTREYPREQAQRLGSIEAVKGPAPTTTLLDLVFNYDRAGNLRCIENGLLFTSDGCTEPEQEFLYHGIHRLVEAVDHREASEHGYGALEYAYDDAGNMTRHGLHLLKYGDGGDLPDAVTTVLFNAYDTENGSPTIEDPCPTYPGQEVGTPDTNGDGIPDVCQPGDANEDGWIDVTDLTMVQNCIWGNPACTAEHEEQCDANGDANCDISDYVAINQTIFNELYFLLKNDPADRGGAGLG
jgi:hypothetical protein